MQKRKTKFLIIAGMALALAGPALLGWSQEGGAQPSGSPQASQAGTSQKPASVSGDYVIGLDDVLAINVWKEAEISRDVQVRPDGKISLPLVGELQAAGLRPLELQKQITDKLQSYVSNPEVTVIVQQVKSKKINVMSEVGRPGE